MLSLRASRCSRTFDQASSAVVRRGPRYSTFSCCGSTRHLQFHLAAGADSEVVPLGFQRSRLLRAQATIRLYATSPHSGGSTGSTASEHKVRQEVVESNDSKASLSGLLQKSSDAEAASMSTLWRVLKPERVRLGSALGALCVSSAVNLSYPYLMGNLVDMFGNSGADGLDFIMNHTFLCGGFVLFGGAATFCRLYLVETAIERTGFRLRRELFGALLRRDIAFFDAHKTGELVNRLGNDITVTSRVVVDLSAGLRSTITAIAGTCMVFSMAPAQMMINLLSPVAVLFAGGVGYGRLVRRISERKQQRLAESVQLAEERLSGIRTVRTFNAEAEELRNFDRLLDQVYNAGRQYALASGGLSCIFVSGGGLFLLHLIYNCGVLVTTGVVSIGTTVTLAMYSFMAGAAYSGMMTAYGDIQKALGACQKVLDILHQDTQPASARAGNADSISPGLVNVPRERTASACAAQSEAQPLAVRFEGVRFHYPSRPDAPVLQGLDLEILAGSRVALLGGSGSGKSTVALLLAGLYAPCAGRILVDGIDMYAEPGSAAWVRGQLGVVSQEPTLFAMSIRDNITYGQTASGTSRHDSSDTPLLNDVVQAAATSAHVNEFITRLPDGLDTPVGERGMSLSGGQRQRVCIARALARSPRMLVFDEATSALDLRSEALVNAALGDALSAQTRTCLVITHRLSALQWVDRVAVMDEGVVVQYGDRDEVMSNPCPALATLIRSGPG